MASISYINGRKKYQRPQAMLWANNPGYTSGGLYIPNGHEIGRALIDPEDQDQINEFMVLSDDNRSPLQFETLRIEKRERMINGRMRSYHISDKLTLSTSWDMLPSRSFSSFPGFNDSGKADNLVKTVDHDNNPATPDKLLVREIDHDNNPLTPNKVLEQYSGSPYYKDQQYTSDGGAGGVELLEWYSTHQDSFWVYLSYDKYTNFSEEDENKYSRLGQYNEIMEMYITNFSYSVEKRGGLTHDLWNISVSLEEV